MPDDFPLDVDALARVLDRLNMGVYITDRDRRIVLWNRKATEITGHAAEEVVGTACHENVLVHADKDGHELCHSGHCPLYRSMETSRESELPVLVYARTASGRRLAVSVSVAPLYDSDGRVIGGVEAFRDETQLVRDMELAKRIQQSQLPAELPHEAGLEFDVRYYPLDLVGGDFYEILPLGPGRYGVLLADVCGHGVSAALYTMQLKSIGDGAAGEADSPAAFMGSLNAALSRFTVADSFATAFYAVVDAEAGTITYANAGHPAPLLFPGDGSAPRELEGGEMPMGITGRMEYPSAATPFGPGDMLLLFTDGATEVADERDELLGTDGLARLVLRERGRPALLERVYEGLRAFCRDVTLSDDVTLLSVTRSD